MHIKKTYDGERTNEKTCFFFCEINNDTDTVFKIWWRRLSEILSNIWWQIFTMIKMSLGSTRPGGESKRKRKNTRARTRSVLEPREGMKNARLKWRKKISTQPTTWRFPMHGHIVCVVNEQAHSGLCRHSFVNFCWVRSYFRVFFLLFIMCSKWSSVGVGSSIGWLAGLSMGRSV